jgi:hypothetical protein
MVGGGVPEHPLDRLDVRPGGHGQARGGVPEVVWRQPVQPGLLHRPVPVAAPEVGVPQRCTRGRREHELVRPLAVDVGGDVVDEEAGERHGPILVRLGRAFDEPPLDLDERRLDPHPSAYQVEAPDPERAHLAPPQAGEHAKCPVWLPRCLAPHDE